MSWLGFVLVEVEVVLVLNSIFSFDEMRLNSEGQRRQRDFAGQATYEIAHHREPALELLHTDRWKAWCTGVESDLKFVPGKVRADSQVRIFPGTTFFPGKGSPK
jgi:hypothetical protein